MGVVDFVSERERPATVPSEAFSKHPTRTDVVPLPDVQLPCTPSLWHEPHCIVSMSCIDWENLRSQVLLILVSSELMQLQAQQVPS